MSNTAYIDLPRPDRNASVKMYTSKLAVPLVGLWTSLFIAPSFAQQIHVTRETASIPATTGIVSVQGVPKFVRFAGTLTHRPPQAGTVRMLFSLYEEKEGQTPLWQEAQDVRADAQGHFAVLLGSTRKDGLPLKVFSDGKAHWLGMQPQPGQGQEGLQQPTDDEERVLLVGVPYALKAVDADTLGGLPASAFVHTRVDPKTTGKASTAKGTTGDANSTDPKAVTNAATTGTGTTNYITRWISSTALGNSFLFQTSTSIGLGTTIPQAKFDVTSSTPATAIKGYNSATTGSTVGVLGQVSSAAGVAGRFNNSVGGQILSGRSKGAELFLVDGLGNVRSSSVIARGHTNTDSSTNINSIGVTAIGGNAASTTTSAASGVRSTGGNAPHFPGDGIDAFGGIATATTGQSDGGAGGSFLGGDGGIRGGGGISVIAGKGTSSYGGVGVSSFGGNTDSGISGDGIQAFAGLSDTGPGGTGVFAEGGSSNSAAPGVALWARPGANGAGQRGLAGLFEGNVQVQGNLSKAGGSFKIDHPLHPSDKYLSHSFVESPDMKNIYDGVARLDATGSAVVQLPEWFQALNRDFRYQLTCIGGFAPVYIAQKVQNNMFKIGGGSPGMEISWQVTGIRHDPWANAHRITVEETKTDKEQGSYLHPELYAQPETKRVRYAQYQTILASRRKALATKARTTPVQSNDSF